jgi:chitinase domain-containing protein 1
LNAPVDWVEQNVEYFFSGEDVDSPENNSRYRSKILLGLNFYGMKYELDAKTDRIVKDPEPIIGSRFIDLMKEFRVEVKYDIGGKEHLFIIEDTGRKLIIFYPTLWSIQKRIDLAVKLGTGLSVWELGQGLNYFYDLF